MSKIRLFEKTFIDVPALTRSRLLIQANSGGGKSWATRWLLEQTHGKVQHIVIDPEGEFSTLREKFDYILIAAGGGADLVADPRYAAKIAEKLLETRADAIIDLYDLNPADRKLFVKNFFTAAINVRKDLYHECWFVLDEAHKFAPEKEESIALESVVDMASRGRKRGFCLIPCTQRPAKLNKDVAAECNNKLIGRASLDIDRKRSAEELGFNSKEEILSLRNLEPGEFFAFGPAISRDVVKVRIGDVLTSHPDVGSKKIRGRVPPASSAVKKILAQLGDLPAEAEQELKTVSDLKGEIAKLKREAKTPAPAVPAAMGVSQWREYGKERGYTDYFSKQEVEKAVRARDVEWKQKIDVAQREIDRLSKIVGSVAKLVGTEMPMKVKLDIPAFNALPVEKRKDLVKELEAPVGQKMPVGVPFRVEAVASEGMTGPGQKVLDAIAWLNSIGIEMPNRVAVAFVSGYSSTSSSYVKTCGALRTQGLVEYAAGNLIYMTDEGRARANHPENPPTSNEDLHEAIYAQLSAAEKKIMRPIIGAAGEPISKADVAAAAEYSETSSSFVKILGRMRTLGLIDYVPGGSVKAEAILFPL